MSGVFEGRSYYVYGLGRSGLPVARRLAALGAHVAAWDDAAAARAAADGVALRSPDEVGVYDALILSPGIPHKYPAPHPVAAEATAKGIPILCDAELLYEAVRLSGSQARFIGVTGTNGKSTTTALVAHMLASAGVPVAAGGNLGTPALALPLLEHDGVYVLEMSSYMLERLRTMRFDASAVLNISPDHLERHGGMEGYVAAKRSILDRRLGTAGAVIGVDDPWGAAMADAIPGALRLRQRDAPEVASATGLPGAHNRANAAAALALARIVGVDGAAAITTFPGLPHRLQRVGQIGGVLWINDSKATNADSAARALACYERVVWIAGGIAKAGGIESLAPWFPRVAHALLIGRDAPVLAATLAAHGVPHRVDGTLDAAVASARTLDAPVVLLSPACASFDQFANFEARGERFADLVRGIA